MKEEQQDDVTVEHLEERQSVKVEREDDTVGEPDFDYESAAELKVQKNGDGESFLELSALRRVTVRMYRRKILVDVREVSFPHCPENETDTLDYCLWIFKVYEKDGKMLPGKKGISLSEEQYNVFREIVKSGLLDAEIKKLKA